MVDRTEALQTLKAWFDSGEAYALVREYPAHHVTGTNSLHFRDKKPAIINDAGVLYSEKFAEYMSDLHMWVNNALRDQPIEPQDVRTANFLRDTLEQMYGSVSLPEEPVKLGENGEISLNELFEHGKAMGGVMRDCFPVVDIGATSRAEDGRKRY